MNAIVVTGFLADKRFRGDWEKQHLINASNTLLHALTVTNKSGSTVWIQLHDHASAASESTPEEYPLPTNSVLSVTNRSYATGLFVRAVTAAGGSTLIAADDIKIQADYSTGPIAS